MPYSLTYWCVCKFFQILSFLCSSSHCFGSHRVQSYNKSHSKRVFLLFFLTWIWLPKHSTNLNIMQFWDSKISKQSQEIGAKKFDVCCIFWPVFLLSPVLCQPAFGHKAFGVCSTQTMVQIYNNYVVRYK